MEYAHIKKTIRQSGKPFPNHKPQKPKADLELGQVLKKVINVFRGETYQWLHILVSNGEELKCTKEHPYYIKGKGWVPAGDLLLGDQFITADGRECSVTKTWIEVLDKPETTYNIDVEDCHNFFVGESGILVHNICVAKEGKLRAVVKNGGDPNHLNTGHAHILDGSTDVASVLKDGSVFSGKLTPKTATFVENHLTEIAEGIDKYYWIGRIKK